MIFMKTKRASLKRPSVVDKQIHNKVVRSQPSKLMEREWNYGLCSCFQDCSECFCAYFCTMCYICRVIDRAGEGFGTIICCGAIPTRTKIRMQRKIKGSVPGDFCSILFCPYCSLIQMGMEARDTDTII